MTTTDPAGRAGLYRLLAWLSPSFPTGAFSYSHGLETAVADGTIHDRATLQQWVAAIVTHGSGRTDADILRDVYRAALSGDEAGVAEANRRGLAYRPTAEFALETGQQGQAFFATWTMAWSHPEDPHPPSAGVAGPPSPAVRERVKRTALAITLSCTAGEGGPAAERLVGEGASLPTAFGIAAATADIPLEDALLGYLYALAGNLVSAGLRLAVIGQTDGQRILAALEPAIADAATAALARDSEDFGSATFAIDLESMRHETQYSRLFRS